MINIIRLKQFKQSGLTLVEMLVVLIIVGLTSTLLVQGLGNALSLYSRVQSNQKQSYSISMIHRWWRTTVSAAAPNRLNQQKFIGSEFGLDIYTYRPLLTEEGIMTRIEWAISDDSPYRLIYRELETEGEDVLSIELPIESRQRPSFEFLDVSGNWLRSWPSGEQGNNLPDGVRINLGRDYLHAAIRNHKDQIFYIDEVEFGRGNR